MQAFFCSHRHFLINVFKKIKKCQTLFYPCNLFHCSVKCCFFSSQNHQKAIFCPLHKSLCEITPLLDQSLDLNERTQQMRWPVRLPGAVARCHNPLATCRQLPIQRPKPIKYIQKKMEAETQQACKERPPQRS